MAGGVNGQRGLSRQSRSQSRLVNLIDALVGIDSTKEDPFMLLTIRQGFFVQIERGYRGVTPFSPHIWQAEAYKELTLSASPTTAVGQKALTLPERRYSMVLNSVLLAT